MTHPLHFNRRQFLALSGGAALWQLIQGHPSEWLATSMSKASNTRTTQWPPQADWVQWRYIAGRITDGAEDYGFVVSFVDLNVPTVISEYQLLVQRQNLTGDQIFTEKFYNVPRTNHTLYDNGTMTYTFKDETDTTLGTFQWDEGNQQYILVLTLPDGDFDPSFNLTFIFKPNGDLIAEAEDGDIKVGRLNGVLIDSGYYADWVSVEIGGEAKGVARLDMQGVRPNFASDVSADSEYAHHWFSIAADLADNTTVWVSAWRIEALEGPYWTITIAQGEDTTWQLVRQLHEENSSNPLTVEILDWQSVPNFPEQQTGKKWQLTAPDGSLDLTITVPEGQFINSAPITSISGESQMQEAITLDVTGTILGQTLNTIRFAAAESTAEFYRSHLPAMFG